MAAALPSPWLVGGAPDQGQGINPAAVGAIATSLGYDRAAVRWVAPGAPSDAAIGVFTSADAGGAQVSAGYAPIDDVVIVRSGGGSAPGRTAFVRGSSGESSVQRIATSGTVGVASAPEALAGVRSGAYAAAVLPLAVLADPAAAPGLTAVARIAPAGKYQPEQARIILPAASPIAACLNGAIDRLRIEGVLDGLYRQWIGLPEAGPAK